jgi:hypothetical protein
MLINAVGAFAAGLTVLLVIVAKFKEGAWITIIAIPALLAFMYAIHRHYKKLLREIATKTPLEIVQYPEPLIVIAMTGWTRVSKQALRSAMSRWIEYVQKPATAASFAVPELVVLKSPYRFVIAPMVNYVRTLARYEPGPPRRCYRS